MKIKPVGAVAGALLAGMAVSGCGFSRSYQDAPPPVPASLSYSQVPGWTAQAPRHAASAYQPVVAPATATAKADAGPMDVTTSLQLVNGTSGSTNPTPMLTITLPAVKFLVPVTGSYSFGTSNNETAAAAANPGADTSTTSVSPSAPVTPPTIQYIVPSSTTVQPTVKHAPQQPAASPPQHLPAFTPPSETTPAAALPKAEEPKTEAKAAAAPESPAPTWPSEAASTEPTAPPPPPAINRKPTGLPKAQ